MNIKSINRVNRVTVSHSANTKTQYIKKLTVISQFLSLQRSLAEASPDHRPQKNTRSGSVD